MGGNSLSTVTVAAPSFGRRQESERRRAKARTWTLRHLGIGGRRRGSRRTDDQQQYSDWYESRFLFIAMAMMLLCSLDATFTLILMQHGASELNVLMASLIHTDQQQFINTKLSLTALGVVPLVAYNDFRVYKLFKVGTLFVMLLCLYAVLVLYELAALTAYMLAMG